LRRRTHEGLSNAFNIASRNWRIVVECPKCSRRPQIRLAVL
jgi:hypothetical protein